MQDVMVTSRRKFLATASAVTLGFHGLRSVIAAGHNALTSGTQAGYGELLPDPHKILDLPAGFTFRVFSRTGERMDDGLRVPGSHDGMAAFSGPAGKTILVRNHELTPGDRGGSPFGEDNELLSRLGPSKLYDFGKGVVPGLGGTTTLVYDTSSRKLERQHLSLAGTIRNCAGGPTPWGSWITCEETVMRAGEHGGLEKDHGYNFEVPASATGLVDPVPLTAMGRFNHEAVAVDPRSGIVYQTEDRPDGLLYRYIPKVPGNLAAGGGLQALAIADAPSADTRNWPAEQVTASTSPGFTTPKGFPIGQPMAVRWIDMEQIDSPADDLRYRGHTAGAARFARGEGMWYGRDAIYFACTNGGRKQKGQVFRYIPSPFEGTPRADETPGTLELFVEPNDTRLVENADNLTVAPWGDLILAEDGGDRKRLIGVTADGHLYQLALNAFNSSEFAGVTFAPDGSTLFVNIQNPGWTIAITGPWRS
jgi:uncharacterized protein